MFGSIEDSSIGSSVRNSVGRSIGVAVGSEVGSMLMGPHKKFEYRVVINEPSLFEIANSKESF